MATLPTASPQTNGAAGPTGPATVSPQSVGLHQRGKALGNVALFFLVKALQFLPATEASGQAVADSIKKLGKVFSSDVGDIERQEARMVVQQMSPIQQPSPQQGQAWQQMVRAGMPPGVGAPPPATGTGG